MWSTKRLIVLVTHLLLRETRIAFHQLNWLSFSFTKSAKRICLTSFRLDYYILLAWNCPNGDCLAISELVVLEFHRTAPRLSSSKRDFAFITCRQPSKVNRPAYG